MNVTTITCAYLEGLLDLEGLPLSFWTIDSKADPFCLDVGVKAPSFLQTNQIQFLLGSPEFLDTALTSYLRRCSSESAAKIVSALPASLPRPGKTADIFAKAVVLQVSKYYSEEGGFRAPFMQGCIRSVTALEKYPDIILELCAKLNLEFMLEVFSQHPGLFTPLFLKTVITKQLGHDKNWTAKVVRHLSGINRRFFETASPGAMSNLHAYCDLLFHGLVDEKVEWTEVFKNIGFSYFGVNHPARAALTQSEKEDILIARPLKEDPLSYWKLWGVQSPSLTFKLKALSATASGNKQPYSQLVATLGHHSFKEFSPQDEDLLAGLVQSQRVKKLPASLFSSMTQSEVLAFCDKVWNCLNSKLSSKQDCKSQFSSILYGLLGNLIYEYDMRTVVLSKWPFIRFSEGLRYKAVGARGQAVAYSAPPHLAQGFLSKVNVYNPFTECVYPVIVNAKAFTASNKLKIKKLAWYQKQAYFWKMCHALFRNELTTTEAVLTVLDRTLEEVQQLKGSFDARAYIPEYLLMREFAYKRTPHKTAFNPDLSKAPLSQLKGLDNVSPFQKGFSWSTYEKLCEWASIKPYTTAGYGADQKSAYTLVSLFGSDLKSIQRFVREAVDKPSSSNRVLVHDAGLLRLPEEDNWNRMQWASFLLAYPQCYKYSQFFAKYEEKYASVASSKQEFYSRIGAFSYESVPEGMEQFAQYCFEQRLEECEFDYVLDIMGSPKQKSLIPAVTAGREDHILHLLKPGDTRALLIGLETDCCQHINDGAASDCAHHSYEKESSGVFVIDKTGGRDAVAQSFVWLDLTKQSLVFDSIESNRRDQKSIGLVTNLFIDAWAALVSQGYQVFLSTTGYGMTRSVANCLKAKVKEISSSAKTSLDQWLEPTPVMLEECDYSDCDYESYNITQVVKMLRPDLFAQPQFVSI